MVSWNNVENIADTLNQQQQQQSDEDYMTETNRRKPGRSGFSCTIDRGGESHEMGRRLGNMQSGFVLRCCLYEFSQMSIGQKVKSNETGLLLLLLLRISTQGKHIILRRPKPQQGL